MNHAPAGWPHQPYTVYMAVLYTKQRTVKLSKMLMKSICRPHRLPQQTRIGRRTAQLLIKAGAWFIHWPVRPVRGLYRPYLPNTKHNIKVTETRVPLNATMAPQRYRISVYHTTNIFYKYRRCTNFVRVSLTQTTTLTRSRYAFVSNPGLVLVLDNP